MRITRIIVLECLLGSTLWATDENEIYVRVQDYSGIAVEIREKALATADLLLERVGVAFIWLDCSPGSEESMPGRCREPLTPRDIVLRLMSEKMAGAVALKEVCLGYALVPNSGLGTFASVFVDKARVAAMRAAAIRSAVLGHAVAHEIGHLLIGGPEHSQQGLMKALWSRPELLRAAGYPMEFSAEAAADRQKPATETRSSSIGRKPTGAYRRDITDGANRAKRPEPQRCQRPTDPRASRRSCTNQRRPKRDPTSTDATGLQLCGGPGQGPEGSQA